MLLLTVLVLEPAVANDSVTIGQVLSYPMAYQMKIVTLHGSVTIVSEHGRCYPASGGGFRGGYTFTLEDETGTIPVAVLAPCKRDQGTISHFHVIAVSDGDTVTLQAQINVFQTDDSLHPYIEAIVNDGFPSRIIKQ